MAREQQFFFGPLFGVLHQPAPGAPNPYGVLICAPFAHEHLFTHRVLVELARRLADAGAHVLRFDYRGHGDSAGAFEDFTTDDMEADTIAAIDELERRSGAPCRVIFGVRFGAAFALRAASKRAPEAALVLWEPVTQGDKYLDEILRVVMSKDVANGTGKPRTRAELRQVLAGGGEVILEGHTLTGAWYRSMMALDLYKDAAWPKGQALILQLPTGKSTNVRKDLETLKGALGNAEVEVISTPCLWWGPLTREFDARNRPHAVLDRTVAWIRGHVPAGEAAAAPPPSTAASPKGERVISFAVEGTEVPGVLHTPESDGPRRPVIVMLPQGMNRRTGWNRLYVKTARTLAARGLPVVRFDARGFGDAPGLVDLATGEDVFVAVQKGLHAKDSSAAIDFARATFGPRPIVLVGVCGGAVTAGLITPDDPRVAGAALVETELTYTTLQAEEEPEYVIWEKLRDPKRWRKLLSLKADYRQHLRSLYRIVEKRVRHRLRGKSAAEDTQWLADALGPTVNLPLFAGLIRTFERKIPLLLVFGSTENDTAFKQVRARLLATAPDTRRFVRDHVLEGADHDFLQVVHANRLIEMIFEWLADPAHSWSDGQLGAQRAAEPARGNMPRDDVQRSV